MGLRFGYVINFLLVVNNLVIVYNSHFNVMDDTSMLIKKTSSKIGIKSTCV